MRFYILLIDSAYATRSDADSMGHGGHVSPLLQMAGHGGTVSIRTTNKKLTELY